MSDPDNCFKHQVVIKHLEFKVEVLTEQNDELQNKVEELNDQVCLLTVQNKKVLAELREAICTPIKRVNQGIDDSGSTRILLDATSSKLSKATQQWLKDITPEPSRENSRKKYQYLQPKDRDSHRGYINALQEINRLKHQSRKKLLTPFTSPRKISSRQSRETSTDKSSHKFANSIGKKTDLLLKSYLSPNKSMKKARSRFAYEGLYLNRNANYF